MSMNKPGSTDEGPSADLTVAVTDAAVAVADVKRVKRPVEVVDQEERTRMRRLSWAERARKAQNEAVAAALEGKKHQYLSVDGSTDIDQLLVDFAPPSYRSPLFGGSASEPLSRRTRDEFVYMDMVYRGQCEYDRRTYYDSRNDKFIQMDDFVKAKKTEEQIDDLVAA